MMPERDDERRETIEGVDPKVRDELRRDAERAGIPAETADDVIREALEEGVAPEKVADVAAEAIAVEAEDVGAATPEGRPSPTRRSR